MIAAIAGPVAIVIATLVVLHGYAFEGLVTNRQADVLAQWMPTFCFLGHSLRAGHVPGWNPFVMGGVPFAADPQSGWMYGPAMFLFSLLPCGTALGWFIALQPILAGLGLYWFLRTEELDRPAAATGGIVLALVIAGSYTAVQLSFSATLAWSAILLAAAARYMRASSRAARVAWLAGAALAWGQLAGAHLSDGMVVGTLALLAYLAGRATFDRRDGVRSFPRSIALIAALLIAFPLVNLAVLLPRLLYLRETSLGALGYHGMALAAAHLGGPSQYSDVGSSLALAWPAGFAKPPGAYLGVAGLALSFAWWRSSNSRRLGIVFLCYVVGCFVFGLGATAGFLSQRIGTGLLAEFYLHWPGRFGYGVLLGLPVLIAAGMQAWCERASWTDRLLMLAPGVAIWGLALGLTEERNASFLLLALGAAAAALALWAESRRPWLAWLVPAVLVAELVANGLLGSGFDVAAASQPDFASPAIQEYIGPVPRPLVRDTGFLSKGRIANALAASPGRYLDMAPLDPIHLGAGYLPMQRPRNWPMLADNRSMLFGARDVNGYNPAQLLAYWTYVRAEDPVSMRYNAAFFLRPDRVTLGLLDVFWIVGPRGRPLLPGLSAGPAQGAWQLYGVPDAPPPASALPSWTSANSSKGALEDVLAPGFDPSTKGVVQGRVTVPALRPGRIGGRTIYTPEGDDAARILVDAPSREIVLIRNSFDRGWHATLDGRPSPILLADYLLQAVAVPAGRHVIELAYSDPAIGWGLAGSAATLGLLAFICWAVRDRERTPPASITSVEGRTDAQSSHTGS